VVWGMAVVSLAFLVSVLGMPNTARPAAARVARVDWCEKLQQGNDALKRGRVDLKDYADDMVFVVGPLCSPKECVGKDAWRNYLEYLVALDTQVTITSCEISGNTIAVTQELRGWHERAAGVDRTISSVAYEFEGDKLSSFRFVAFDMKDPQSAEFVKWYFGGGRAGATFAMGPGRDADQSPGVAVLERYPDFSAVAVRIAPGPAGVPQPIHIHKGTCANLGPVAFALRDVDGGVSHTVLRDVPLVDLQTGNYAIAVQQSEDEPNVYVACGDIPALAAEVPPAEPAPAAEQVPVAVAVPPTGSGGLLAEDGGGVATWWYALAAGGALLVMAGLAGLGRARSRR
jgi:hypothetical protein